MLQCVRQTLSLPHVVDLWLQFDPQFRILSGTPSVNQTGTYQLSITVSDGIFPPITQSASLTVKNPTIYIRIALFHLTVQSFNLPWKVHATSFCNVHLQS